MKLCTGCNQLKELDRFAINRSKPDGLHSMCRDCKKIYNERYYVRTKHIHNPMRAVTKAARLDLLRSQMMDYLSSHPCVDCGESDPVVLDFDHQRDKVANVGDLMRKGSSWERILAEIEKCEVVCANDHRRRTAKQFGWYRLLET